MLEEVPLVLVEDGATLKSVVADLEGRSVIAIDTESDSFHHYEEKVCLIQVSDTERDYIIDPLRVTDLSPLAPVLANPAIVKVLHGADYDVVCMRRDFGITFRGLFDTMVAASFLNSKGLGLADLVGDVFGITLDKQLQRHDWAERPLKPEHLEYARGDTHWLIALREVLIRRLERHDLMEAVTEEFEHLERREWTGRRDTASDFMRIRGAGDLSTVSLRVLRELTAYRDQQARRLNRPVFKVIPDPFLLKVAQDLPKNAGDLASMLRVRSPLLRQHGTALLAAVERGLQDETPLPGPVSRNTRPQPRHAGPEVQLISERLRTWRNEKVESDGIQPMMVASNSVMREIAHEIPRSIEELSAVPEMRRWQVRKYGQEILSLVQGALDELESRERATRRRRRRRKNGDVEGRSSDQE